MSSNKESLQKIAQLSIGKIAIAALVITGVYYTSFFDDGSALSSEIQGLEAQLSAEQAKKKETENTLQKEEQMRADVAMLAKAYEEVKAQIPLEFETAELRAIVKQIADQVGIKILKQKDTQSRGEYQGQSEAQLIESIYVDYVLEGNYNQISQFFQNLSQTQKIIRITDFKIGNMSNNSSAPAKSLNFEAKVVGYKQSEFSKTEKKISVNANNLNSTNSANEPNSEGIK